MIVHRLGEVEAPAGRHFLFGTDGRATDSLVEGPGDVKDAVAELLGLEAGGRVFPEVVPFRIGLPRRRLGLIAVARAAVGAGRHDQAIEPLQVPAVVHQVVGEPVEQLFFWRRRAAEAEVGDRLDERPVHVPHPNVIDGHPRSRVAVDHVWMRHMNRPLVESVADFGLRSPSPPEKELLDWLANDLIDHGWNLKRLDRLIVTSTAYRRCDNGIRPRRRRGRPIRKGTTSGNTGPPASRPRGERRRLLHRRGPRRANRWPDHRSQTRNDAPPGASTSPNRWTIMSDFCRPSTRPTCCNAIAAK